MTTSAPPATYEEIVDRILERLASAGALRETNDERTWDSFGRTSAVIHHTFDIPPTAVTPMMRRLLFALGRAARPRTIAGVGTYVGYAFAWLLGDASDPAAHRFDRAVGIDVDRVANEQARRNCDALGHADRLSFLDEDGAEALRRWEHGPIDILYLDLDDPVRGKRPYVDVLAAALPHLAPGALVLGHDPCVERFKDDIARYHEFVRASSLLGPWVLGVDACGLSVAGVPVAR
jgi:predicted O-methyltransferase YrrM